MNQIESQEAVGGRLGIWSAPAERSGDGALAFWSVTLRNPGPGGQGVGRGAHEWTVTGAWTGKPKRGRRCALPPHSTTSTKFWRSRACRAGACKAKAGSSLRSAGALHIPRRPPTASCDSNWFMAAAHICIVKVEATHEPERPAGLRGRANPPGEPPVESHLRLRLGGTPRPTCSWAPTHVQIVRGQSAAATPLWLTRPSIGHGPLVCPPANSLAARAGIPQGH